MASLLRHGRAQRLCILLDFASQTLLAAAPPPETASAACSLHAAMLQLRRHAAVPAAQVAVLRQRGSTPRDNRRPRDHNSRPRQPGAQPPAGAPAKKARPPSSIVQTSAAEATEVAAAPSLMPQASRRQRAKEQRQAQLVQVQGLVPVNQQPRGPSTNTALKQGHPQQQQQQQQQQRRPQVQPQVKPETQPPDAAASSGAQLPPQPPSPLQQQEQQRAQLTPLLMRQLRSKARDRAAAVLDTLEPVPDARITQHMRARPGPGGMYEQGQPAVGRGRGRPQSPNGQAPGSRVSPAPTNSRCSPARRLPPQASDLELPPVSRIRIESAAELTAVADLAAADGSSRSAGHVQSGVPPPQPAAATEAAADTVSAGSSSSGSSSGSNDSVSGGSVGTSPQPSLPLPAGPNRATTPSPQAGPEAGPPGKLSQLWQFLTGRAGDAAGSALADGAVPPAQQTEGLAAAVLSAESEAGQRPQHTVQRQHADRPSAVADAQPLADRRFWRQWDGEMQRSPWQPAWIDRQPQPPQFQPGSATELEQLLDLQSQWAGEAPQALQGGSLQGGSLQGVPLQRAALPPEGRRPHPPWRLHPRQPQQHQPGQRSQQPGQQQWPQEQQPKPQQRSPPSMWQQPEQQRRQQAPSQFNHQQQQPQHRQWLPLLPWPTAPWKSPPKSPSSSPAWRRSDAAEVQKDRGRGHMRKRHVREQTAMQWLQERGIDVDTYLRLDKPADARVDWVKYLLETLKPVRFAEPANLERYHEMLRDRRQLDVVARYAPRLADQRWGDRAAEDLQRRTQWLAAGDLQGVQQELLAAVSFARSVPFAARQAVLVEGMLRTIVDSQERRPAPRFWDFTRRRRRWQMADADRPSAAAAAVTAQSAAESDDEGSSSSDGDMPDLTDEAAAEAAALEAGLTAAGADSLSPSESSDDEDVLEDAAAESRDAASADSSSDEEDAAGESAAEDSGVDSDDDASTADLPESDALAGSASSAAAAVGNDIWPRASSAAAASAAVSTRNGESAASARRTKPRSGSAPLLLRVLRTEIKACDGDRADIAHTVAAHVTKGRLGRAEVQQLMRSFDTHQHASTNLGILDGWVAAGRTPTEAMLAMALVGDSRTGRPELALQHLRQSLEITSRPRKSALRLAATALVACGHPAAALRIQALAYAAGVPMDVQAHTSILLGTLQMLHRSRWSPLQEVVVAAMEARGVRLDSIVWGHIVQQLAWHGDFECARSAFHWAFADGTTPDQRTTLKHLMATVRGEAWAALPHVLDYAHATGVQLLGRRRTLLVTAAASAGRLDEAHRMFCWPYPEDMRPDGILYSALMHVLGEAGRVDDVLRLFKRMRGEGIEVLPAHIANLVHACMRARQFDRIPDMLKLAAGGGFVLDDARITSSRITAAMEADNLGAALEAWQHFQQAHEGLDDFVATVMLGAYNHFGKVLEAEALADSMCKAGIVNNERAYMAVVTAMAEAGRIDDAVRLFLDGTNRGHLTNLRRGTDWEHAAVIDLHSLAPGTARVALIAWLRYLRWLAAPHGGANPWPERKTAVIVTGWGRNSDVLGVSPLREATRKLLEEGLGLPLPYETHPANPGRFQLRLHTLFDWLAAGGCRWA